MKPQEQRNPDATELRDTIFVEFSEFTQHAYLLLFAASKFKISDYHDIAKELPDALSELIDADDESWNGRIEGDSQRLADAAGTLSVFVVQSLIVQLDAQLHSVLDRLNRWADYSHDETTSFEEDLKQLKEADEKLYRGVVMLAEFRNCIVHSDGRMNEGRHPRLLAAGWSEREIQEYADRMKRGVTLSDFLRLKGIVRATINFAFQSHGCTGIAKTGA